MTRFETLDADRVRHGFRTLDEMAVLAEHNVVFDPYSTLIGAEVEIGTDNMFHPGVLIRCADGAGCVIGDGNTFHLGTDVLAGPGAVVIGDGCVFGPGGALVNASEQDAELRIGDRVRLRGGAEIMGASVLGAGSQVLGPISARGVRLAGGGEFTEPDPDLRGAVLKGFGRAVGIELGVGEVINGLGDFAAAPVERQLSYHPRTPAS